MGLPASSRLRSVDLVRGLVCVLMAIDHVRVYSGIPAGGPTADVFLTRWVTHFVAPGFALFAGTGAYFLGRKLGDPGALARFLVSRGLLLVLLELTVIRFFWAFYVNPAEFTLAGVIWMLGWCMVLLAAFVRLPARTVGIAGVAIMLLQQVFGLLPRALPEGVHAVVAPWWAFLYPSGAEAALGVNVLYVLVPWIGVMMAGYGLGTILERETVARDRWLTRVGLGGTMAWLVLATVAAILMSGSGGEAAGDESGAPPLWMQLLNQQKYPASQLFLLMTLGPALALMPWAARAKGWFADAMVTFGRVPMFYYLAHILVIHVAAIAVNVVRIGETGGDWYTTAPYTGIPDEARWPLWLLYAVFVGVVGLVLYPACRWYAGYKAAHPGGWRQYI